MADENKNAPDAAEFEAKMPAQSANKDLWLFLIIIDVVFLCIFGFFLYKNLSARLLSPAQSPAPVASQEQPSASETAVEAEITLPEENSSAAPAVPAAQPQTQAQPLAAEAKEPAAEASKPAEEQPSVPAAVEKKESISIKVNPKSKYRQVTFRYFGEADRVSVVSGFTMAKPRALKKKGDHWEVTLGIAPGTYKFLYIVDGKQMPDPYLEEQDGRSVLVIE